MNQLVLIFSAFSLILSWLVTSHFPPWMSWHSEALAFFAVLLLSWGGLIHVLRFAGPRTVALPVVTWPLISFAMLAVFQKVGGLIPFWGDVWVLWFYMALCIASLALGYAAASSAQPGAAAEELAPVTMLAFALLFGAVASSAIAFAQVFSLWEHSGWLVRMENLRRPGGNLAQPNHLATLLVMGVASLVFLYQSKKLGAFAVSVLLFLLCAGIAVTESRTGALSMLALLGWWLLKRRNISDSTPAWVGVGCSIGFVGMFWAWPHMLNAMDLLGYQVEGRGLDGSLRLQVWPQLLKAVATHPWTGWGILQVTAAHNTVADAYEVSAPFSYSHNLVLDLALWVGIPLALLLVGLVVVWLWRRVRTINHLLPWYGLAVALPLGLHSMFEFPFSYAYFLVPVMFLLGMVEASLGSKPLRIGAKSAMTLLLLTTVVLAWSVVEYLQIEEDFRVARFESLHVGSPPPDHQRPKVILFDQLGVLLDDTRITPTPKMSPEEMQVVKDAALHYPWPSTQYRYALALALNGNPVEAARQIQVIRRMRGEQFYDRVKRQIDELANSKYPELRQLKLY